MGLVDYSDSDSETESPKAPEPSTTAAAPPSKKPFQKLVDKTNPGKILVNLPSASTTDHPATSEEPAAKRAKTGGSRFSGFGSFLPAPKANTRPPPSKAGGEGNVAPKVGVNLKTSAEAAFSREGPADTAQQAHVDDGSATQADGASRMGLNLPPPKASTPAQPAVPQGQKPEDEVKLVGKPLMFKPLSVARKPAKKTGAKQATVPKPAAPASAPTQHAASTAAQQEPKAAAAPKKKKVSLFSIADDTPTTEPAAQEESSAYEPEFTRYDGNVYDSYQQQQYANCAQPTDTDPNSLNSIANDLNLDAAARRELFGRGGGPSNTATAKSVINFNLDQEYQHNEELRASGALEQQQHNPLRAIKPGKHSLQQLVNAVQSQKDALEENFAKNRATQKQAGSKYGFR